MTASDYKKAFKQLKVKPIKLKKFIKHNKPKDRKFGRAVSKCSRCGRTSGGIISKYSLKICRQCFREVAEELGFKKYE